MQRTLVKRSVILRPRFRVLCDGETVLGPGRVDVLELIGKTGSLRSAATGMGMSYMRVWKIVKSLNAWFRPGLVEVARGGKKGGGAKLTDAGREVVRVYRRMEKETERAVGNSWKELRRYLVCKILSKKRNYPRSR